MQLPTAPVLHNQPELVIHNSFRSGFLFGGGHEPRLGKAIIPIFKTVALNLKRCFGKAFVLNISRQSTCFYELFIFAANTIAH